MPLNILYLHAHDAGRFISPYGHPLPTPNLERFSRRATLFRNAYCCGPTCSPSRAGLLTGVPPHQAGMLGLAHRGFRLRNPSQHLAAYLKTQGYTTALAGVQHEFSHRADPGSTSLDQVYDHRLQRPIPGLPRDLAAIDRTAGELAAEFLRSPPAEPFFLSCGMVFPHRDFPPRDADLDPERIPVPPWLPNTPETRLDMAEYATAVRRMDEAMAPVLHALQSSERAMDTVVLVTTDHGIAFPDAKCHLYDSGIGVLLMLDFPGNRNGGRALDSLVSHLDLFPTLCDLAGVPCPEWPQGHSLRPLLEGSAAEVRREIFSEVTYHAGYEPQRCIRTQRHKLIRHFDPDLRPNRVNCDDSKSKHLLMEAGYFDQPRARVQLYDLLLDPAERHNLADDPACQTLRQELEARLDQWMRESEDPLLHGQVPAPSGAKVNPRWQKSPGEQIGRASCRERVLVVV